MHSEKVSTARSTAYSSWVGCRLKDACNHSGVRKLNRSIFTITQANPNRSVPNTVVYAWTDHGMTTFRKFWVRSAQWRWNAGLDESRAARVFLWGISRLIFRQLSHKIWRLGDQHPHHLFWVSLHISETNGAKKLIFGMPVYVLGPM